MIVSKGTDDKSTGEGESGRELGVRTEWIWQVVRRNEKLGVEVLGALRGKNEVWLGEAEDAEGCGYHWHEDGEVCPLAGK